MSKRPDAFIRAFGMSGAQIASDIEALEQTLDIQLSNGKSERKSRRLEHYEQFDKNVRDDALDVSEFYEIFYCLENSIRNLISETLKDAEGSDWWESGRVHPSVGDPVKERIKKELESGITPRSNNKIDYTTFGELIILINKNWDLFDPIFKNQQAVQRVIFQLNTLRNPIAHCCPISPDEKDRLILAVKDWFRVIS